MATRARALAALLTVGLLVATAPTLAVAKPATPTPPPTPVLQPNGHASPSPFPTVLRTPAPSSTPPDVHAAGAALADLRTGQLLFSTNADARRPIASVTKIMTAMLVLRRTEPDDIVTVSAEAVSGGRTAGISELGLQEGERITVENLLYALMLQSANDAAVALADHVSGSVDAFVHLMNHTAHRLGMRRTRFTSPNGLTDDGYSTAADLVRLTRAAFGQPRFGQIARTKFHEIPDPDGTPRLVQNRNVLLWLYPGATGTKTGYTSGAGFCVVATADREDVPLVAVVLGEPHEPFSDAAALLNYGYAAFEQKELVSAGEPLGALRIDGREVPVAAGRSLSALVPADDEIARRLDLRPGVRFPPPPRSAVGTLTVSVPEMQVGRVPAIVVAVPPPPAPTGPGPWWRRAAGALFGAVGRIVGDLFD